MRGDKIDIFKDIYNVENLSFYKIKRIIFNNKVSESYILFENKLFLVLFEDNTLFSYEIENFEIDCGKNKNIENLLRGKPLRRTPITLFLTRKLFVKSFYPYI